MSVIFNKKFADMSKYEQLVSRLEHIDRAFIIRRHIKLHHANQMPNEVTDKYGEVIKKYLEFFMAYEESLLWFISVELHSRFISGSALGLYKFICGLEDSNREGLKDKLSKLTYKHGEIICYFQTQRDKFLAHADNVSWDEFPNVFDQELGSFLCDLKKFVNEVGETLGESRRVTTNQKLAENQTSLLFDDLLILQKPEINIGDVRKMYNEGVEEFLKIDKR